jgi:hypothetical protein
MSTTTATDTPVYDALAREFGAPTTPHVFLVSSCLPGYLPNDDNPYAVHATGDDGDDGTTALVNMLLAELAGHYERRAELLQHDADERAASGHDPDVYTYALSDAELCDAYTSACSWSDTYDSSTRAPGTVTGDIAAAVRDAIRAGVEYGVVVPGDDVAPGRYYYFVAPVSDDDPVCSDAVEFGSCDYGCTFSREF